MNESLDQITKMMPLTVNLLREASDLLDDASQEIRYGGDAANSLNLERVKQWQARYQAFIGKWDTFFEER